MNSEVITWVVALVVASVTVSLHFNALRYIRPYFSSPHRFRSFFLTTYILVLHVLEIAAFAFLFWFGANFIGAGSVEGASSFRDYLYFSTTSYTSLGLGDLYPTGALRILVGIEALVGLTMIAWTGAFAYSEINKESPSKT